MSVTVTGTRVPFTLGLLNALCGGDEGDNETRVRSEVTRIRCFVGG